MIDTDIKTYLKKDGKIEVMNFDRAHLAWWQILNSVKIAFDKAGEPFPEFVLFEEMNIGILFVMIMPKTHGLEDADEWLYRKIAIEQELKFQAQANNPELEPELAPVKFYLL